MSTPDFPDAAEIARRETLTPDARRIEMAEDVSKLPENERGGPRKIEPTRYGDWERKGIAYDF